MIIQYISSIFVQEMGFPESYKNIENMTNQECRDAINRLCKIKDNNSDIKYQSNYIPFNSVCAKGNKGEITRYI